MPYIEAVEGKEQTPRIMGGTRISVFTLDDTEYFEAKPDEGVPHPYTYDSSGDKVALEHTDIQKVLDGVEAIVDNQITLEYLKQGKLPHVNIEIFMHNDLFGVSVNAMSVGEETRRLAEKIIAGPAEADYAYDDEEEDDGEIVIEQWEDRGLPPLEEPDDSIAESEPDESV